MSAKFLETVGNKLAERWVATILTPAFVFWAGGLGVALKHFGWTRISSWLDLLDEPFRTGILIAILCLITASAFVVQRFDLNILRFLEGYWPHLSLLPTGYLRSWLIGHAEERSHRINDRWRELIQLSCPTREQRAEISRLDWQQQHLPLECDLMPTRLGNLLRSAEGHSLERYGLDAIVCWPRLWILLPESVKNELRSARSDLNAAARAWLWCLLFTVWGFWLWWLLPIGLLAATWSYYGWAIPAAENYGELIRASFDIYRKLLYDGLRWHLPEDPEEERRVGKQLTMYLWRGVVA